MFKNPVDLPGFLFYYNLTLIPRFGAIYQLVALAPTIKHLRILLRIFYWY